MNKLNKKIYPMKETVEAYDICGCSCNCGCDCGTDSNAYGTLYSSNSTSLARSSDESRT